MPKKNDVYVFIDSQNLHHSILSQGWEIDYKKLYILLKKKYKATKIFYFIGYSNKNKALYSRLEKYGYVLIFKPTLVIYKAGVRQLKGNVDGELILQAMIEYRNYRKAIIVSGDGDYLCLIQYLNKRNKLEKIIVPDINNYSRLLKKYANKIVDINLHQDDIERE